MLKNSQQNTQQIATNLHQPKTIKAKKHYDYDSIRKIKSLARA